MEPWEQAVATFLRPWMGRDDVRAVLLYGSFADGTATAGSDIDLLVVLADGAGDEPPRLCTPDGFLVEAFFITPEKLRVAFETHRARTRASPPYSG